MAIPCGYLSMLNRLTKLFGGIKINIDCNILSVNISVFGALSAFFFSYIIQGKIIRTIYAICEIAFVEDSVFRTHLTALRS